MAPSSYETTAAQPPALAPEFAPRAFALVVTEGANTGARFEVRGDGACRVLLGKGPACEIQLDDAAVSRRHLALDATERGLRLTDLESTNGTLVNGVVFFDGILRGGETIRVGSTTLLVEAVRAGTSEPLSRAM